MLCFVQAVLVVALEQVDVLVVAVAGAPILVLVAVLKARLELERILLLVLEQLLRRQPPPAAAHLARGRRALRLVLRCDHTPVIVQHAHRYLLTCDP